MEGLALLICKDMLPRMSSFETRRCKATQFAASLFDAVDDLAHHWSEVSFQVPHASRTRFV